MMHATRAGPTLTQEMGVSERFRKEPEVTQVAIGDIKTNQDS